MPDMLPDIGLAGRAQAGKDTLAAHLVAAWGYTRVAFADAVREMALAVDPVVAIARSPRGLDVRHLTEVVAVHGWEDAKRRFPEVRRFLQRLGTEGVRDIHGRDAWVRIAMRRADAVGGPVVFTDVRFLNEAEAVRDRGGLVARVIRPSVTDAAPLHESETALDDLEPDWAVLNAGPAEALQDEARRLVSFARLHTLPLVKEPAQ